MTLARRPAEKGGFSTLRRSRKPSKRSQDPVTPEVYDMVYGRSGGRCEAPPGLHRDGLCRGRRHIHHRLPVSWGGGTNPANLLVLCSWVHSWAHNNPSAAVVWGLLVPRRGNQSPSDPARYPVNIRDGRRVRLTDDGRYEEVA